MQAVARTETLYKWSARPVDSSPPSVTRAESPILSPSRTLSEIRKHVARMASASKLQKQPSQSKIQTVAGAQKTKTLPRQDDSSDRSLSQLADELHEELRTARLSLSNLLDLSDKAFTPLRVAEFRQVLQVPF